VVPPERLDRQGPILKAEELHTESANVFLEDADLAALGEALRLL